MARMADTVLKNDKSKEREMEARFLQYANERDLKAEAREKAQRDAARRRDIDVLE